MKLQWIAKAEAAPNGNMFMEPFDVEEYNVWMSKYRELSAEQKKAYRGAEHYATQNGCPEITPSRKNYKKLVDEIAASLEKDGYYNLLPVDPYSEKETVMDLLASVENENYIKSIYKKKKLRVSGALNTDTATKLMDSIRQGRSLLQSAQAANMLSKPLIDFYAASAYAYASIVINSPLHKALDSLRGSHGHTYNHTDAVIEFGGDMPSGTFIDLLSSQYLPQVVTDTVQLKCSAVSSLEFVQKHKISISMIALLSTVPELHDQVMQVPEARNMVHPLTIQTVVEKGKVVYKFEIGDGIQKPSVDSLRSVFDTTEIVDANGKFMVQIPLEKMEEIIPTIYQDIKGKLWYIEPLVEGFYLPEMCLHFLIISALCNIMRYSPHEWNNILSNKISSEFSLLISKYLRLFELKYPMLVVQQLTNFRPIIKA